jgi:putative transposase
MIRKACLSEGVTERGLVLNSDNGSPMKGATIAGNVAKVGCGAIIQPPIGEQR